jgi:hypothetical protein
MKWHFFVLAVVLALLGCGGGEVSECDVSVDFVGPLPESCY